MSEEGVESSTNKEASDSGIDNQHEQSEKENPEQSEADIVCNETMSEEVDPGSLSIRLNNETPSLLERNDSLVGKLKIKPFASLAEPTLLYTSLSQVNRHVDIRSVQKTHQELDSSQKKVGTKYCKQVPSHLNPSSKQDLSSIFLTPVRQLPYHCGQPRIPTNNIPVANQSVPFNSTSGCHRPLLNCSKKVVSLPAVQTSVPPSDLNITASPGLVTSPVRKDSTLSYCTLPTVQNSCVPPSSDLSAASSGIASSPPKNTFWETGRLTVEEIKCEVGPEAPETDAVTSTTPTSISTIIKDELDLGVGTGGASHQEWAQPRLNNPGDNFLTSDSIAPDVQTHPSTSAKKNSGCTTRSNLLNISAGQKLLKTRYQDVEPQDLKPAGKPDGKRLCKYCDFRHNSEIAMKKHRENLHSEKYHFRCFLCLSPDTYSLPTHYILEHHVATVHRGERRVQCLKCWKSFKTLSGLKRHKTNICREIDPYACHLCDYTCKTQSALEKHGVKHDETIENCSVCQQGVKKFDMKKHMYYYHSPKKYMKTCQKCDYTTTNKATMWRHYSITLHNKNFLCELCRFATNSEEAFNKHVENCSNDPNRPYQCNVDGCGKIFNSIYAYSRHIAIHKYPESRVFRCPDKDCDFETIVNGTLVRHMKFTKHHLQFKCSDCTHRYRTEESLASHIQKVHVEKIIRERFSSPNEYNEVADHKDTQDDAEVYETDPYAHFKKGWLGTSCFEEEENSIDRLSSGWETPCAGDTQDEVFKDESDYTYVSPEISCMVECSHEGVNDDSGTLDNEAHETMTVSPSVEFFNLSCPNKENTSTERENLTPELCRPSLQADDIIIKPDPDLYENPDTECGNSAPSLNSNSLLINSDADRNVLHNYNSQGPCCNEFENYNPRICDSPVQTDDFTVKPDPDLYENPLQMENGINVITHDFDSLQNHCDAIGNQTVHNDTQEHSMMEVDDNLRISDSAVQVDAFTVKPDPDLSEGTLEMEYGNVITQDFDPPQNHRDALGNQIVHNATLGHGRMEVENGASGINDSEVQVDAHLLRNPPGIVSSNKAVIPTDFLQNLPVADGSTEKQTND